MSRTVAGESKNRQIVIGFVEPTNIGECRVEVPGVGTCDVDTGECIDFGLRVLILRVLILILILVCHGFCFPFRFLRLVA